MTIFADIPGFNCPTDIFHSKILDILLKIEQTIIAIELTVCFETNTEKSRQYKRNRYRQLKEDILIEIEEFDEDIANELRNRARDLLLTQAILAEEKIDQAEPADDLLKLEGMDKNLAFKLASEGIVTRENLAELATDDLLDIKSMYKDIADALIMKAREHWFEDNKEVDG